MVSEIRPGRERGGELAEAASVVSGEAALRRREDAWRWGKGSVGQRWGPHCPRRSRRRGRRHGLVWNYGLEGRKWRMGEI
jgi:hypothetical protein